LFLPCRYEFFQQSPLLGASQYEAEFDYNGTRVFVTTCIVEG
jgi:starch synthase